MRIKLHIYVFISQVDRSALGITRPVVSYFTGWYICLGYHTASSQLFHRLIHLPWASYGQ